MESVKEEKPVIILTEHAAQPCTTIVKYIGGEYMQAYRKWTQKKFPGATAIFVQGCDGNTRVQVLDEKRRSWVRGTPEDAERFGHDLADAAERAIATKKGQPIVGPMEIHYKEVPVPVTNAKTGEPAKFPFRMQTLVFGRASQTPFILVGLGASPSVQYQLNLEKKLNPANTIVVGCANAMAACLPTAKEIRQGGYEPSAWGGVYGLPGPYLPEVEDVIIKAVLEMAKFPEDNKN